MQLIELIQSIKERVSEREKERERDRKNPKSLNLRF